MRLNVKNLCLLGLLLGCLFFHGPVLAKEKVLYYYGNPNNDVYRLLKREGMTIQSFDSPAKAIGAAAKGAGVIILAANYPKRDAKLQLDTELLAEAHRKQLRLYVEYPSAFPGMDIPEKAVETTLERGVVTQDVFGGTLKPMALLGIHDAHVLPVEAEHPLLVLAKVVGFDQAEYGLKDTKAYPLLFWKSKALLCMTGLSNFQRGRYGPNEAIKQVWSYILAYLTEQPTFVIKHWEEDVQPMYSRDAPLPAKARLQSIKKGTEWFYKGHFFPDKSWVADVAKYGGDGLKPIGPPVDSAYPNGDGTLGILEGHISRILYNGQQGYRYWMRADVQGEAAMTLAAAGKLFDEPDYLEKATNLMTYVFTNSNLRQGPKKDPNSAAFGLLGWATTNAGTFYGDDNARAILGMLAASAYLQDTTWQQALVEAIMANFRTTGKQGFRGERLEEADIIKNGWPHYYNRDLVHISPHFESWMWACYLWLYAKTGYQPLLDRTKEAIRITMQGYPDKWLWGSSMQTQRARIILPLAWLVRIEDTPEHRQWLDHMVNELLKYQDACGAIQEELGKGKGMFKALNKNEDYGSDEGSLIFRNGEKVSCMLYTNNFALFSLNEAAQATGIARYQTAAAKLSTFLTRIQVQSKVHPDLDGAWFRGFDYGRWDYWASNSDAGWGAWCTLTGWIQSWIVTTQTQLEQHTSFWQVTEKMPMSGMGKRVIHDMMEVSKK